MNLFNQSISRRGALQQAACGFGSLALAGLCADSVRAANPIAAKEYSSPPKGETDHIPVYAGRTESRRHIRL